MSDGLSGGMRRLEAGRSRYATTPEAASKSTAARSQVLAICRKISRSLTDLAVLAQPTHSAALARYSFDDATIRSIRYVPVASIEPSRRSSKVKLQKRKNIKPH